MNPTILFIEDDKEIREFEKKNLEKYGCNVLDCDNSIEAIKTFMLTPGVSLVLTDIDLKSNSERRKGLLDKSGIHIAQFIRNIERNVPIIGYSGCWSSDQLSNTEKSYFSETIDKSILKLSELRNFTKSVVDKATNYAKLSVEYFEELANDFVQKNLLDESDLYEFLKIVSKSGLNPILQAKEEFQKGILCFRVVKPTESNALIDSILLLIVKEENQSYHVEIYGFPELYSYAENLDDAVHELLLLMKEFANELSVISKDSFAGPAYKLRSLILETIRVRNNGI